MTRPGAVQVAERLEVLQRLARKAADESLTTGPTWIADASLEVLEKLRLSRALCQVDVQLLPQNLREHLGASWVDAHSQIHDAVAEIDHMLCGLRDTGVSPNPSLERP